MCRLNCRKGIGTVVKDDFGDVMGMFYAMTSDGYSDREMGDYAELIKREPSLMGLTC